MNKLDEQYRDLLLDILTNGVEKETRNGKVFTIFGRQFRHNMKEGFPLLTSKKMAWNSIVTELLWFLRGDTNIKYLLENDCYIWVGDAYKRYLTEGKKLNEELEGVPDYYTRQEFTDAIKTDDVFAEKWGELGPIYGHQWRNWNGKQVYNSITKEKKTLKPGIDQIKKVVEELHSNPDSRRLLVSAWNPEQLDDMVLPPCHYGFQLFTREITSDDYEEGTRKLPPTRALSLMWNQRSVDVPLGLPFNIASYGLLLLMIADEVNMVPDQLIANLGDTHIYSNQITGVREQLARKSHPLPEVYVRDGIYSSGTGDIILKNYVSEPPIKFPLSN